MRNSGDGKWHIRGHDTFSNESYSLPGDFGNETQAQEAADKRLEELEKLQPKDQSGGQTDHGIQDAVYVIRPDSSEYRR